MVAQPVLPTGGLVGWRYLVRTEASQSELVRRSPDISRESAHFRDRIANIETAADLVADRQLLKVALGAFGLDDDIDAGCWKTAQFAPTPWPTSWSTSDTAR